MEGKSIPPFKVPCNRMAYLITSSNIFLLLQENYDSIIHQAKTISKQNKKKETYEQVSFEETT